MFKAKVLVVGPTESGKSVLANFISDATETIAGEYNPTQGVRILECECPNGNKGSSCEVELWDCGGDSKFKSCWPVIMKYSHGVIIVFNSDIPSHLKEIEISSECECLLIAHKKPGSGDERERLNLAPALATLTLIYSNLEDDPEDVRMELMKYLRGIVISLSESRDQEEMSIIT
uniref:Intraflagellar transport protein 22 homolog n=1 Tax=Xenopus tropicalis TaxID=8364 RepID=A0A310T477_XENTR